MDEANFLLQWQCLPTNCAHVKRLLPCALDGEYTMQITGQGQALVYCHNMQTDNPLVSKLQVTGQTHEYWILLRGSGSSDFTILETLKFKKSPIPTYYLGMDPPYIYIDIRIFNFGPPTVENCWCWSDFSTICWSHFMHFNILCWTYKSPQQF